MIEAVFDGESSALRTWQPGSNIANEVLGELAVVQLTRFNDILRRSGNGLIGEAATFSRLLNGDERRSLLAYFREKWDF